MLSTDEARARAAGKPWSFLHISKPEIDLPPGTDPYAPEVYAKAAENLERMLAAGVLARDAAPCYYVYRLVMGKPRADRAGGGRLGRRVRRQPHPQPRVDAPGQGGRPRAPDRGAQRPDRPGAARLPAPPAASTHILARGRGRTPRRRTSPPTTACATRCG
ncbi:MAG: DUF1015 domain-containing protein [Comamonadaceae bacterium]|nr:DUF1015 domain-containing protein [Comamonadaceae bacterium]